MELGYAIVISQKYSESQPTAAPPSDADIDAFYKEPGQEERFQQFVADAKASNPMMAGQQIPDEQMKEIRRQLATVLLGERKGIARSEERRVGKECRSRW